MITLNTSDFSDTYINGVLIKHRNDIFCTGRTFSTVENKYALAKISEQVVKTVKGELQFKTDRGIPYFQTIWNGAGSRKAWADFMVSAIEGIDGIEKVLSFNYAVRNRVVYYTALIRTVFGDTTITAGA